MIDLTVYSCWTWLWFASPSANMTNCTLVGLLRREATTCAAVSTYFEPIKVPVPCTEESEAEYT